MSPALPTLLPARSVAPDPDVPTLAACHQAWPRRTTTLRGPIGLKTWWTWVGNLARLAHDHESWSDHQQHGWTHLATVLTMAHEAWDRAQAQGSDRIRVEEYSGEQPGGDWALLTTPWTATRAQRHEAASILRQMNRFGGSDGRTFETQPRDPQHRRAQERCQILALDLLVRTAPGWTAAWFGPSGMNAHPAFVAIQRHQPRVLNAWLERGLFPDLRSDGRTLLQEAAWQGHDDLVGMLLNHGAHPNLRRKGERSPLERSLAHPDPVVFDTLIAGGATWPEQGFWINPAWTRVHQRWTTRPVVMEVAMWAREWAWDRWRQAHPGAWDALDLTALDARLKHVWRDDVKRAGNPGTQDGPRAFHLPLHERDRLDQAHKRCVVVTQKQILRQAMSSAVPAVLPSRPIVRL